MLVEAVYTVLFVIILAITAICSLITWARHRCRYRRQLNRKWVGPSIGFFHPYCNMGGGGERVLWCAIRALQNRFKDIKVVIYTGDIDASPTEIMHKVENQLNIILPRPVDFIYLHKRAWVEAERYPCFTLLGQSLGSVVLGIEAMNSFLPDVYIDTMGYAFTLPIFKYIGGCNVSCYIHYPTITRDMLRRVSTRVVAHNNSAAVAKSPILSFTKVIYYRIFAWLYSTAGRYADITLVNSSWTEDHINKLWNRPLTTHLVYPPCDTNVFKELEKNFNDSSESQIRIVSVGQFRPEKDHPLQLKALYQLRGILPEDVWEKTRLIFVGSCRNAEDERRVQDMRDLCKHLSLENNVEFKVNVSFEELKEELSKGLIGLHAMWNEHFGIGVVECMAAGLIMVAHKSGGPKMDIVEEAENSRNGFLASDEMEYAKVIAGIIKLSPAAREQICTAARASVDRFSVAEFESGFIRAMDPFFSHKKES